jgi:hypothetical protein
VFGFPLEENTCPAKRRESNTVKKRKIRKGSGAKSLMRNAVLIYDFSPDPF